MPDLTLYGRPIGTVFDLLGDKENDLTYALGWGLAKNPHLAKHLLQEVFPKKQTGDIRAVRLQEFEPGGGFTDIEIESERAAMVLEAKRGWNLPTREQLTKYTSRLMKAEVGRILVVAEAAKDFAEPRIPRAVAGVPVAYRSWRQVVFLAEKCLSDGAQAERRLLRELITYLRGLMTMQNRTSNIVYVAALGTKRTVWSGSLTPIQIVTEKRRYFHPVGEGYPKEPQNYVGFRWHGQLQQIHHVESYEVCTDLHEHFREIPSRPTRRHFIYKLGKPIRPSKCVKTGNIFRGGHAEAAIDLLLTCNTISEARDKTRARLNAIDSF